VTISVIDNLDCRSKFHEIKDDDFEYRLFSGTGKGGQHRNRHQNSVVMTHIPSGIKQTVVGRSEEQKAKQQL
jgi:protein subunit release factor A